MGMFDTVVCEVELPGERKLPAGEWLQTKDFDCHMQTYTIRKDGYLLCDGEVLQFDGLINFYAFTSDDWWFEYEADYQGGVLHEIRLVKQECVSTAARVTSAMKAPWKDFAGADIHEGDVIVHPATGERGTVVFLPEYSDPSDQWRVAYQEPDGGLSRLCLQIGDKGQAVVVERAAPVGLAQMPPRVITRVLDDGLSTKDGAA